MNTNKSKTHNEEVEAKRKAYHEERCAEDENYRSSYELLQSYDKQYLPSIRQTVEDMQNIPNVEELMEQIQNKDIDLTSLFLFHFISVEELRASCENIKYMKEIFDADEYFDNLLIELQ